MIQKMFIIFVIVIGSMAGQGKKIHWQKKSNEMRGEWQNLFHSATAINLPTTTTMQKGDFEFEISHRFYPSISGGEKDLFGFDGPAYIRFALGYAVTDQLSLYFGRSNQYDNYDLKARYRLLKFQASSLRSALSLQAGAAVNTEIFGREKFASENWQPFAQLIYNGMWGKHLGLGFVASYLHNSDLFAQTKQHTITTGLYSQYYFLRKWSFLVEWNPVVSGYKTAYDMFSFGVELETGGHFFKLIATNNFSLNNSLLLPGADNPVSWKGLRLGFTITRAL